VAKPYGRPERFKRKEKDNKIKLAINPSKEYNELKAGRYPRGISKPLKTEEASKGQEDNTLAQIREGLRSRNRVGALLFQRSVAFPAALRFVFCGFC